MDNLNLNSKWVIKSKMKNKNKFFSTMIILIQVFNDKANLKIIKISHKWYNNKIKIHYNSQTTQNFRIWKIMKNLRAVHSLMIIYYNKKYKIKMTEWETKKSMTIEIFEDKISNKLQVAVRIDSKIKFSRNLSSRRVHTHLVYISIDKSIKI